MTDKTINGRIVVDWKQETLRSRKTKPSAGELGTNELLAAVSIDVTIPDVDVSTFDEDLPDWSNVANDKIESNRVQFRNVGNAPEWKSAVDETTMDTLREVSGRQDPDNVREYVESVAMDMYDEEIDRQ